MPHKVIIVPDGEEIYTTMEKYWFEMTLEVLPRGGDGFTIEDSPEKVKELTGASEFYGIADHVEYVYDASGKLKRIAIVVTINEEIEEEIIESRGEPEE